MLPFPDELAALKENSLPAQHDFGVLKTALSYPVYIRFLAPFPWRVGRHEMALLGWGADPDGGWAH